MKKTLTLTAIVFVLNLFAQDKIVFTSNPNVNFHHLDKNEIKTSFSIKDDIYALVTSSKVLKETLSNDQRFFWLATKNLPDLKKIRFRTLPQYCLPQERYFIFPVMLQKDEKEYFSNDAFEVTQHLNILPSGNHKITVLLKEGGDTKFSGSFTLEIPTKKDNFSQAKKINPNTRKDKGYLQFGMKNADVEDEILSLFQETYPKKGFKRVIITSKKYYYKRDEEWNVVARLLDADILVNNAGKCKAYDVTIKQDKLGQNYGILEEVKVNGYYTIDCQGL